MYLCVCVWSVYLGSKSPAAGPSLAMRLCVRTYSSVFGEGIMRDERPTSTQNRMKGRTRRERESPFTNSMFSSCLFFLLFSCTIKRVLLSKVPRRTRRAYIFSIGGSAGIAPPAPSHHRHPGGGGAKLCQLRYAGPHTSFLLVSPSSLQTLL